MFTDQPCQLVYPFCLGTVVELRHCCRDHMACKVGSICCLCQACQGKQGGAPLYLLPRAHGAGGRLAPVARVLLPEEDVPVLLPVLLHQGPRTARRLFLT